MLCFSVFPDHVQKKSTRRLPVSHASAAENYVSRRLDNQIANTIQLINEYVAIAKRTTDSALDKIGEFDKTYPTLLATKQRLEVDLKSLQSAIDAVKVLAEKENIDKLAGLALALKQYIEGGNDVSKLLGGLANDLENLKALTTGLETRTREQDSKNTEVIDKLNKTINARIDGISLVAEDAGVSPTFFCGQEQKTEPTSLRIPGQ